MNADDLSGALLGEIPDLAVEPISEQSFRVLLPTFRDAHDVVAIGVTEVNDGTWVVSDGGQLAYLLEGDFDGVVDAMECAGAIFNRSEDVLEYEVESADALTDAVLAFGYYVGAAPTVWHALNCARPAHLQRPSSIDEMAKETRNALVERVSAGRNISPLIKLKYRVADRGESTTAPLAIASGRGRMRAPLVASFIDATAVRTAITSANKNTALLFQIVRDWATTRKYVVVRGDEVWVEHYAKFYDTRDIVTVPHLDPGPLYEDAGNALDSLVGRP